VRLWANLTTHFLWKRVTAGLQIVRLGPSAVTLSKAESSRKMDAIGYAMAGRSGFIGVVVADTLW